MSKNLLPLLLAFIFVLVAGSLYFVFRPQITNWIESVIVKEESEQEAITDRFTCDGETYQNNRQGYKVCYPSGWETMAFGYSQLTVGFDPFPIPEASEYPGTILVFVTREGSPSVLADYLVNLEDPSTSATEVGGVTGIRVAGTLPSDDVFFPNYFQIVTVLENLGRTYLIQLLSNPDVYEGNLLIYDEFVDSMAFLDNVSSPPWGEDIFLTSPWPQDSISSPFSIAGEAQGAFENTIIARLKNSNGEVIVEIPIIYNAPDVGQLGSFSVEVSFSTSSVEGLLEVFHTSAKDGSIVDLVSVPLEFNQ